MHTTSRASLLGLPAELRNHIYDHVASATSQAVLNGTDLHEHEIALGRTSRQIREEYMPILLHRTEGLRISYTVFNLSFGPLMRFLTTCGYLPEKCKPALHVKLIFNDDGVGLMNRGLLKQWKSFAEESRVATRMRRSYKAVYEFKLYPTQDLVFLAEDILYRRPHVRVVEQDYIAEAILRCENGDERDMLVA